ncbi:primase subunit [Elephant endotheliotropic herpesvirus 3A]|uniref:Primase subunit n=1 Tax=Elephant endotheliotropic herpesvirus 3A TaxID=1329409 RepID=A0A866VSU3_9BETA|nr:primase subunit [Elephant endotheliotropic herpesvirus 3A]QOE74418.1 primase subunit [Elephant endotheliotropic herpesvirus 3A]
MTVCKSVISISFRSVSYCIPASEGRKHLVHSAPMTIIQVLFATEYDSANIVVSLICGCDVDHLIYPLLYKQQQRRQEPAGGGRGGAAAASSSAAAPTKNSFSSSTSCRDNNNDSSDRTGVVVTERGREAPKPPNLLPTTSSTSPNIGYDGNNPVNKKNYSGSFTSNHTMTTAPLDGDDDNNDYLFNIDDYYFEEDDSIWEDDNNEEWETRAKKNNASNNNTIETDNEGWFSECDDEDDDDYGGGGGGSEETRHGFFQADTKNDDDDAAADETIIAFCLQTQSCENSTRVSPVFYCRDRDLDFINRFNRNEVLSANTLGRCLDEARTLALYRRILSEELPAASENAMLANNNNKSKKHPTTNNGEGGGADAPHVGDSSLRRLVYFNRDVIVKYLTENFTMPTSPAWFSSVYGPYEAVLILTMYYYLFERQYSTVQTTQHYAKCFTEETGRSLMSCYSMRDFMRLLHGSPFLRRVAKFSEYCRYKNDKDHRELVAIDESINAFRQNVCLTDAESVHFMYLAFGTALGKSKFAEYTIKTSYVCDRNNNNNGGGGRGGRDRRLVGGRDSKKARKPPSLSSPPPRAIKGSLYVKDLEEGRYRCWNDDGRDEEEDNSTDRSLHDNCYLSHNLKKELLNIMEAYFTPGSYLSGYVKVHKHKSDHELFRGYGIDTRVGESVDGDDDGGHGKPPQLPLIFSGSSSDMSERVKRANRRFDGLFEQIEADGIGSVLNVLASSKKAIVPFSDHPELLCSHPYPPSHDNNNRGEETMTDATQHVSPERHNSSTLDHNKHDNKNKIAITRREVLFPGLEHPAPLYRTDCFQNMQVSRYFSVIGRENWVRGAQLDEVLRNTPDYVSDEQLTECVWLPETRVSSGRLSEQLYRSRHEIFNDRLPVYNFVGDLDLDVSRPVSREWLFGFCRNLRRIVVQTFSRLFSELDERTHPVYFFKSQCEPEPGRFCSCAGKLGMRVITPFPRDTVVLGGKNVKALCEILNHVLFLDPDMFPLVNGTVTDKNCFDTGIYSHGRSIRMPLTCKIDEDLGFLQGKLMPVFIVPEGLRGGGRHREFVRAHLDVANWLHHNNTHAAPPRPADADHHRHHHRRPTTIPTPTPPPASGLVSYILSVEDVGRQNESSFIDTRLNKLYKKEYVSLDGVLESFKARYGAAETAHLLDLVVWPHFARTLRNNYSVDASNQFSNICFDVESFWPTVQIYKIQHGTRRNFFCIQHDHRNARDNVNFFLDVKAESSTAIWFTLWSRCFARKCKSNSKNVHVSHKLVLPS